MSYKNNVNEDIVILNESINVVVKCFLTQEYDRDCERYFSHVDPYW